jgi:IS30 family transposase
MCRKYTQLTIRERYVIELLKQEEHTQNYISEILGRDKSTISSPFFARKTGFSPNFFNFKS